MSLPRQQVLENRSNLNSSKCQFVDEVFPAELEELRERRLQADLPVVSLEGPPDVKQGLVGLALSGGGIRSATFCLGAVQKLAGSGLLKHVDYLSTVSGGGFMGSCVSSLMQGDPGALQERKKDSGSQIHAAEPPIIRHLRNSSKYLAPGGFVDELRMAVLILRGIVVNFLVLLPYIILLVLATELIYQNAERGKGVYALLPLVSPAVLLLMIVSFPLVSRFLWRRLAWTHRDRYERAMGTAFLLTIISLLAAPAIVMVSGAIDLSWHELLYTLRRDAVGWLSNIWIWLAALIIFQGIFVISNNSRWLARWRGKVALYFIGLMGPLSVFLLYILLCAYQIESPYLEENIAIAETEAWRRDVQLLDEKQLHQDLSVIFKLPKTVLVEPVKEAGSRQKAWKLENAETGECYILRQNQKLLLLFHDYSAELAAGRITPALHSAFARKGGLTDQVRLVESNPDILDDYQEWKLIDEGRQFYIWTDYGKLRTDKPVGWGDSRDWGFLAAGLVLLFGNLMFININLTSAHTFYRDRLSRAYLVTSRNGDLLYNDRQLLSNLGTGKAKGPLHLINAALNLRGSPDAIVRGRHCDFFTFSKLYCGSEITGFCKTTALEQADRHLDLGTAMAISGAAAAPNAGVTTVGPLVFILTVLNVRLGYWLPNPLVVSSASSFRCWLLRLGPPPRYLLKEAVGRLRANRNFVNVSDGGHIENLGVYELLRRRCKVIISVDSEADPEMRFGGLLRLVTYARVDLGIHIDIDLSPIRSGESGWSQDHYVVGKILYGGDAEETGTFIYIKSSMTGDEDEALRDYKHGCPSFPHEPTANQFFTETQFESYRRLGFHATGAALKSNSGVFEAIVNASAGTPAERSEPAKAGAPASGQAPTPAGLETPP